MYGYAVHIQATSNCRRYVSLGFQQTAETNSRAVWVLRGSAVSTIQTSLKEEA
jgi:hypothetical protein